MTCLPVATFTKYIDHVGVKFGDLLADKNHFRHFLLTDLKLNASVADEILNATVSTDKVLTAICLPMQ